jgi:hypothetical protein
MDRAGGCSDVHFLTVVEVEPTFNDSVDKPDGIGNQNKIPDPET